MQVILGFIGLCLCALIPMYMIHKATKPILKPKEHDIVFYHSGGPINDSDVWNPVGWYFWFAEERPEYHGPFLTEELCREGIDEYVATL